MPKSSTSPTQRTLKLLRAAGLICQVVERWCQYSKRRIDLFGCIDVVCIDPNVPGCLGVQATSGANHSARVRKILSLPEAKSWVQAGNRIAVYSWKLAGPRGKAKRWTPRIEPIELTDFAA